MFFVYTNANYFFLDFVTFYGWTYSGELHVKFVLLLIFRSQLGVISSLFWSKYSTCYPIWKSPDGTWQMLCHLSLNGWTLHSIHYVKGWKNGAGKELTITQNLIFFKLHSAESQSKANIYHQFPCKLKCIYKNKRREIITKKKSVDEDISLNRLLKTSDVLSH